MKGFCGNRQVGTALPCLFLPKMINRTKLWRDVCIQRKHINLLSVPPLHPSASSSHFSNHSNPVRGTWHNLVQFSSLRTNVAVLSGEYTASQASKPNHLRLSPASMSSRFQSTKGSVGQKPTSLGATNVNNALHDRKHQNGAHEHENPREHDKPHSHSIFGHSHSHGDENGHTHEAEQIIAALKGSRTCFDISPMPH